MEKNDEDRSFLHDLATPLTIARTLIKRHLAELKGEQPSSSPEKQIQRLEKVLDALSKMETLHSNHKDLISRRSRAA